MNTKSRIIIIAVVCFFFMTACFSGGVLVGWTGLPVSIFNAITGKVTSSPSISSETSPNTSSATSTTPSSTVTPISTDKLFSPFWNAWDLVHTYYVQRPVDDELLMRGAIRGMIESLGDQHSSYMDPDQYEQLNTQQSGEYEGIGAWVDITGEYLIVIAPMKESPAEKAGLKAADVVIAVDGEDMTGVDGNIVLSKILGTAGTKVTLTIQREGVSEPFDVTITRAKITVPSVTGEMLEDSIGYIQISTFGDNTTEQLKKTLKELLDGNPKGLVIDLRGNGGGYLNVAVEVISQFVEEDKVLLIEQFGDGTEETLSSTPGGLATDIPIVLLVNSGTASASEIMTGVIQDYKRGVVVGTQTYGKGSVQIIQPLENNEGAVRITLAHWFTPNRRLIHEIGIEPDYIVEYTQEDYDAGLDPQLDKAIEILKQNGN